LAITAVKPEENMTVTQVRSEAATKTPSDRLYLDDLHVGQRLTSETSLLFRAESRRESTFALDGTCRIAHSNGRFAPEVDIGLSR
jgi:hypothetical protein